MIRIKHLLLILILIVSATGCNKNNDFTISEGKYRHSVVQRLSGFEEERTPLLKSLGVGNTQFIALSTDSAWSLKTEDQVILKNIRNGVSSPDTKTLLQKVIPLEDISTYMNNIYGGTIGGFVSEAADMKYISTMYDVYWGLRLDYSGTKFRPNGAGYAVIRFMSSAASRLQIPFSPELGGKQPHAWPNGGGGFTTSTLGKGGYPEWVSDGYNAPEEGAELFEVTPEGREILRSVYTGGKWQTYESNFYPKADTKTYENTIRNGVFDGKFITTVGWYEGHKFIIRAEADGMYHLTTTENIPVAGLKVMEKGIYGLTAEKTAVQNVQEEISDL